MSLVKQLSLAVLSVGVVVGALAYLGQQQGAQRHQGATGDESSPSVAEALRAPTVSDGSQGASADSSPPAEPISHPSRQLVPPEAWLVVDFEGSVFGATPFADQAGFCAKVPAPERVVVALLPPSGDKEEGPELLLAAPKIEEAFWGCTRDRIVVAGGNVLAQNDQFEVIKSPSGIVARGPTDSLLFLSGDAHLEQALSVLSQLGDSAASRGPHVKLFRRMHPMGRAERSAFDLTLALPLGWLDSVGDDARLTPLRFVSAAYLSAGPDGSASGGIDCEEQGCADVLTFLQGARDDLLQRLPRVQRTSIQAGLSLEHIKGAGRIVVTWTPSKVGFMELLNQALGLSPLSLGNSLSSSASGSSKPASPKASPAPPPVLNQ